MSIFFDVIFSTSLVARISSTEGSFLLLHAFKIMADKSTKYIFFMIFFYLIGMFNAVSKAAFLAITSNIDCT